VATLIGLMRRLVLVALLLALGGCGGGSEASSDGGVSQVPEEGGLRQQIEAAQTVKASDFPDAGGRTLQQIANEVRGGGSVEVGLATSVFTVGRDRLAFGVIDDEGQFVYGPTAVYVAPTAGSRARGPFAAPADVLVTEPRYRSKQAAQESDPFAAVYQAQVQFRRKGAYEVLVVTRQGDSFVAAPAQVQVTTKQADAIPDVGEAAPKVKTDTLESVKGNRDLLDTRTPPSEMHKDSFDQVVGKKPVALLFATPQLCQSRVCGPVTDVALQLQAEYGDRIEFIHQEVYEDNDPQQGLRKPLQEFRLPTEPWLFVVGEDGRITARLEGSFGLKAFDDAVQTAL
jgi:hypothetical protein